MKIVSVVKKKKKNPKEVLQMAKLGPEQECEDAEPSMLEGGGRVLRERTFGARLASQHNVPFRCLFSLRRASWLMLPSS